MSINQWLNDLALLPDIDIQQWQTFLHSSETQTLGKAELEAALVELGSVSGWLTETSRVIELENQTIKLQHLPLEGEFFSEDKNTHKHWQLTQLPREKWQLTRHEMQPSPANQANCLAQPVTHLHASDKNKRLKYWKLWTADKKRAPEANIALLTAIYTHKETRA